MGSKDVDNVDFSIEFYAKTRSEHVSSYDHGDAEFADLLFGVNSFQENKNDINNVPVLINEDFSDEKDHDSNGSNRVLEKKQSLKKMKNMSMWGMIHEHMVSGLAADSGDMIVHQQVDQEQKLEAKDFDDDSNQETEIRKMFAIKLVRDAIEKILLPEVQDDQSTTSEVTSEQDLSETIEITSDRKDESPAPAVEEKPAKKTEKGAPDRWSYLKKVILLKRFVNELEKVKKFNPKQPRNLRFPVQLTAEPETETVSLRRRQTAGDKKRSDEWMLDYALQKVVSELAPTQKRKVALLVKAFETVAPAQDDPQDPRSNVEVQTSSSESKGESKTDLENEKRVKMWHMVYQHVVTDIATKIGSDLLLDREESATGDRSYRLQFTQSDAVKLVRASVDEILSNDSQSSATDMASDQEQASVTKLQNEKSKNWEKLKHLIMLKRSIKALEGFRNLIVQTRELEVLKSDQGHERVDRRRKMIDEKKKAEQWMLDYAVQHIVTKLTPDRKMRVSMLVEAFEAVVPFPEM